MNVLKTCGNFCRFFIIYKKTRHPFECLAGRSPEYFQTNLLETLIAGFQPE
jgi:hypothetical protein